MDNFGQGKETEAVSSISSDNNADAVESFEMVSHDCVPDSKSEEVLCMTNSSSGAGTVVECIQQISGECIGMMPMTINLPDIGVFSYLGSFLPGPISNHNDEDAVNLQLLENELEEEVNKNLNKITSSESERRHRDCLLKAIEDNCKGIIVENVSGDMEISLLERRGCINKEDSQYLRGKSVDPTQCMRALFAMMLDRDLKTLLTFAWILKLHNNSLFDRIIGTFHHYMHTGYGRQPQCLRCVLIDRVNIRLVVDYLDISKWRKFYQKVTEAKLSDSGELWKEFFKDVNSRHLYEEVMPSLLRAIRECHFHSDVLLMMQNDAELKVNSFDCRCIEIRNRYLRHSGHSQQILCSTETSICSRSRPDFLDIVTNNQTLTFENYPDAHGNTAAVRKCCSEGNMKRTDLQSSHSGEGETKHMHSKSVALKRRNSDREDEKGDERPKKKVVEHFGNNLETKTENTGTQTTCEAESRHTKNNMRTCKRNVEGKQCDECEKKDSLDNLTMDRLKVGVPGYDSEHDSGFSPNPSLFSFVTVVSDSDSGVYDQNTEDKHETIPKQVVCGLNSAQARKSDQNQDPQALEDAKRPYRLESIDADNPIESELYVNQEALKEALEEPSVNEDVGVNTDASFDTPVSDSERRQNEQMQADSTDEPFINIKIKKR